MQQLSNEFNLFIEFLDFKNAEFTNLSSFFSLCFKLFYEIDIIRSEYKQMWIHLRHRLYILYRPSMLQSNSLRCNT